MQNKNKKQALGGFRKLRPKFSDNPVKKLRSCEAHTMCCLNQTKKIQVSLNLKISPKQHFLVFSSSKKAYYKNRSHAQIMSKLYFETGFKYKLKIVKVSSPFGQSC